MPTKNLRIQVSRSHYPLVVLNFLMRRYPYMRISTTWMRNGGVLKGVITKLSREYNMFIIFQVYILSDSDIFIDRITGFTGLNYIESINIFKFRIYCLSFKICHPALDAGSIYYIDSRLRGNDKRCRNDKGKG